MLQGGHRLPHTCYNLFLAHFWFSCLYLPVWQEIAHSAQASLSQKDTWETYSSYSLDTFLKHGTESLSFFLHDYNQGVDCLEMEESQATRWVCISSYIPCWKKQSTKREYYRKREDLAAMFSWLGIFFPPFLVKLKLLIVCIKEENDFASSLKIKALAVWSLEYSISFQFDLYINKPQNCDIILFMRKCIRMEQKKAFC